MVILAIDPGPTESAYVVWDHYNQRILYLGKVPNQDVLSCIDVLVWHHVVCERIRSYGMPAGAELFETCEWSGRFWQAAEDIGRPDAWHWLPRKDVKLNLCGSPRAKDANVRQALVDRFGGKELAIGKKATPGPLYGISGDMWSALAVAITWCDLQRMKGAA